MSKKLQKTDIIFTIALLCGLAVHIYFSFLVPYGDDESYYATIPFRLINGDSLLQHEWHLTQFSSLFTYLPTYIWTAVKGSTDGILLFLRYTYIIIHTTITVIIYKFFRKHGIWAVMAAIMWYTHVPYRILSISYLSVFVICLLLLSFCLVSIYQQKSSRYYILAGICYACCCVCNPLFCLAFIIYIVLCIFKIQQQQKQQKKSTKSPSENNFNCFFTKEAVKLFSIGIFIVAVIAVLFFFLTGGNIRHLSNNIENLFRSSEYNIISSSIFLKLAETLHKFVVGSLGAALVLPIIAVALIFDKKRKTSKHRLAYLSLLLLWSIWCILAFPFAFKSNNGFHYNAVSMPFFVFSTVCYCLTENKNKILFYCMYLPCLIGTVFQYLAANTFLYAIGTVLTTCNVAGMLFTMDLFKELKADFKNGCEESSSKKSSEAYYKIGRNIIIAVFCLQMIFNGIYYHYKQPVTNGSLNAAKAGPYAGLYMTETQYDTYIGRINDMDYIKSISYENEPVLLISNLNWMYLYLERPIATYSTWMSLPFDYDLLTDYYKSNTKKIPAYIYIDNNFNSQYQMKMADEVFDFTSKELSCGTLLTVIDYNS